MGKMRGSKKSMLLYIILFVGLTAICYWKSPEDKGWMLIMCLGFFTVLVITQADKLERRKEEKRRKMFFMQQYPVFAGNVSLLLQSGMSPRSVFLYLAKEYDKEDLMKTELENLRAKLSTGYKEVLAYRDFGEACRTKEYRRLMNLVIQYLEQGTKFLGVLMDMEMKEASKSRVRMVRQQGEEISVKLLLPMGLLLMDVMAIVVAPIFSAMQLIEGI